MSRRLWIDTDLALGATSGDVDDGFALAAVLRAVRQPSDLELAGISCVSGNTPADAVHAAVAELLARYGDGPEAALEVVPQKRALFRFDRTALERIAAQGPIGGYLADGARR